MNFPNEQERLVCERNISNYYEVYYHDKYARATRETEKQFHEAIAKERKKRKTTIGVLVAVSAILIVFSFVGGIVTGDGIGQKKGYDRGYYSGYEFGYNAGHYDGYEANKDDDFALQPLERPYTGEIVYDDSKFERNTSITVTAPSDSDVVVSLKNLSKATLRSFYVRAGETASIRVPAVYLYVYFAFGTTWYGYGEGLMFGDGTVYSKDDDMVDFDGKSWEYSLSPVKNGNFSETPTNENDFFD